jgi:hypothetical protein
MKITFLFFFLPACLFFQSASAQKSYDLEPFDALSVSGNIEVVLHHTSDERAVIEVFGAAQKDIALKVVRGELRIHFLNSLLYKDFEVKIAVHYNVLRNIKANAGARITATGQLRGDKIELRAGSGAQMDLELAMSAVGATAAEGGVLRLSGVTRTQTTLAASGGRVEAFDLQSERTYARAVTGGQAFVTALRAFEATAHTGGAIEYKGDPEESNVRNIITGDIRKTF